MSSSTDLSPPDLKLYGSNISYFTGKLENYFRLKSIPYTLCSMQFPRDAQRIKAQVGVSQMPAVRLADGRWMTDSTKIIQWFEAQPTSTSIMPTDPLQAFLCLLLEDYADEWLWRPAMHYRWHYAEGAHFASRHLADELTRNIRLPGAVKRWQLRWRQRQGYTIGDGITGDNIAGIEKIYSRTLQHLQTIFCKRPFIMGQRPSLADIGFAGPFFRHFGLDPVPLEIMRQHAPAVLEWIARLWNTRIENCSAAWPTTLPDHLGPLLDEIGQHYLPYLCANADAVTKGQKRFNTQIGGIAYQKARYSRYRVGCLQELRLHYEALPNEVKAAAETLLKNHHCWEPLWQNTDLPLLPDQDQGLPFSGSTKMIGVNE